MASPRQKCWGGRRSPVSTQVPSLAVHTGSCALGHSLRAEERKRQELLMVLHQPEDSVEEEGLGIPVSAPVTGRASKRFLAWLAATGAQ